MGHTSKNKAKWLAAIGLAMACSVSQAQTPIQAASQLHPLAQHMQLQGVRKCVAKVDTVAKFVTAQQRSGSLVFPIGIKPDESVYAVSSELVQGQTSTYITSMFAPTSNECVAVFETMSYHAGKCEEAMQLPVFAKFKDAAAIEQNIKAISIDPTVRVMFVPAGPGCMVVKKQILP